MCVVNMVVSIVDLRINETLQTGAVSNRTYRGAKVSISPVNARTDISTIEEMLNPCLGGTRYAQQGKDIQKRRSNNH